MLIIASNVAEQQFKEEQISRISVLVEWTVEYFCKKNIEAWISAGYDGWVTDLYPSLLSFSNSKSDNLKQLVI